MATEGGVGIDRIHAIVNPASANGRTRREWPRLRKLLESRLGEVTWTWTEGPGHAVELARNALQSGCRRILSVGGDGTHREVGNAFLGPEGPTHPQAIMATLSRGTGSDFTRSLGIPREPGAAVEILAQQRVGRLDAGWFTFRDAHGRVQQQAFLNIASLGISGAVDRRVNQTTKALGGFASFLWATLATLITYRAKPVRFSLDSGPWREERVMLIAVANGQYFGGGMWVAPTARLNDGAFDVVLVHEMALPELISQLAKLYRGTHLNHPRVETHQACAVTADSPEEVWLDADGEPLGTLPLTVRIMPRSLKVLVGPGFQS